eukprot:11154602-Lingulodinium_polyedra.AAC.1
MQMAQKRNAFSTGEIGSIRQMMVCLLMHGGQARAQDVQFDARQTHTHTCSAICEVDSRVNSARVRRQGRPVGLST